MGNTFPVLFSSAAAAAAAAPVLGLQLSGFELREPPYDCERAFSQSAPDHRGSLFVMVSPFSV
ncbi:MAG: hypothetical protein ACJ8EA_08000, partial [Xanthobacteraceae bacterium]